MNDGRISPVLSASVRTRVSVPIRPRTAQQRFDTGVKTIAARVEAGGGIRVVKGNGPAPGYHVGPDRVRTAFYFQDPDGLEIEVYSPEIEMLESNPQLISQHLP